MKERDKIKAKFGGKCAYCGDVLPEKGWHIDHSKPIRRNYKTIPGHYRHKITKEKIESKKLPDKWYLEYEWMESRTVANGMMNPENDVFENKIPACASCNINKHNMDIEEFRAMIQGFTNTLNERIIQYKIAKRYGLIQETEKKVIFYFETLNS